MREAGLNAHIDALGSVIGRIEGADPDAPALLIGSHIDSVVDAGRYDGNLGVVLGIVVVEALRAAGHRARLPHRDRGLRGRGECALPDQSLHVPGPRRPLRPGLARRQGSGWHRASRCADPLRRRSGWCRGARPRSGALSRLSRGAYRAGTAPGSEGSARRHRLRHQRHHPGPRHRHRRGGPCRHRADGHAPRRAGGGRRDDRHRGARRLHPHRHGGDRRRGAGAARRNQRHSRTGRFHPRRALAGRCGAPRHGARTS